MKTYKPLFFLASFVLIIGLACGALSGGGDTPTQPPQPPTNPPPAQPTQTPPQPEPTKESSPTETPASEAAAFFTEEFDGDLSNWTYWVNYGDENGLTLNADRGTLNVLLEKENTSVYIFYDPYTYSDVVVEMEAKNSGKNNNNVSLVCRYDENRGSWYEFSIANNGLYWIYAVENETYNEIFSGGSTAIKQGRDTNVYRAECVGNELALFINGEEVRSLEEKTYRFEEGQVAFNVTSFNVLPIDIDVEYFKISEP
jgi:hypothetical protein